MTLNMKYMIHDAVGNISSVITFNKKRKNESRFKKGYGQYNG